MSILSTFDPAPHVRNLKQMDVTKANQAILKKMDYKKGALFSSGYEYPGGIHVGILAL